MKAYTFEEIKDRHIGKIGTKKRDKYEHELNLDLLGLMIKETRKQRNLTQEELGELIGVNKSEISKLESNARNMRLSTIIRVFEALKAKIKIKVEVDNMELMIA